MARRRVRGHLIAVAAAALLAAVAVPAVSRATIEIYTSDDGLRTVEFTPSLKLFFFGATGFFESPDGWGPELFGGIDPGPWVYPNVGGGMFTRLRLRFLADITDRIRFVVHYEHRPRVMSHGRILATASQSIQGTGNVPMRLTPLQWRIAASDVETSLIDEAYGGASPTFVWEHELDRLFLSFSLPRIDITIGRQAVGWGVSRLWSPMDIFSPFTATDLDREERRGVDAVRLTLPFSPTSLMEVVVAGGANAEDQVVWSESALAWMLRLNIWDIEWMLMAGKVGQSEILGGAINGQIRGVALRGEVTASNQDREGPTVRATAGIEFGTSIGLTGTIEYHYNGFGTLHTRDYLETAEAAATNASNGHVAGVAQHYAGITLAWQPIAVLSLALAYVQNCQDGSLMINPTIEYSISDNVRLAFSGIIPIGRDPEWNTGEHCQDGICMPVPELRLHSEYGAAAQMYVLQLRAAI